jgi:4-amino-4-deoxy-L-arabinose transferase-like glycosyltransferase
MRFINSIIACLMLGFMFVLMFFSSWNDSAIMDESAHIPAGYSYLTLEDYRLNPEHPPLIKDLAAFPLLYLDLKFPTDAKAWQNDVNGQWDMGRIFLYESGNDADKILHSSRFPIMLLALLFGWLLFRWVRKIYGDKVGLLTLFFFSFSPTFLAHSRYVTTDLGAAFGFFIGIVAFINFLKCQNRKNLIIAGVVFGIAEMLKFSLILLAPLYVVFGILWVILENWDNRKKILGESLKMLGKIAVIGIVGLAVITVVYQFHVWNYPAERQATDTAFILTSFGFRPAANLVVWMANKPVLRSLGQYLLGILMVIQRSAGGNTAYFMGEISAASWRSYFPLLYLFKEHLAFHIFALIALVYSIRNILKAREKSLSAVAGWMKDNFVLVASIIFIATYWTQAISSNLNIGIRHVLPTFPFIYLLVSRQIVRWSKVSSLDDPQTLAERIKCIYESCLKYFKKYLLISFLVLWIIIVTVAVFPFYLSYYNELGGGVRLGYKIAADSNYDWGQDLKRLKNFVEENNLENIAVDYFGGGSPKYYLGEKFQPWWSAKGTPPKDTWLALSINTLQSATAEPAKGFVIKPEDTYSWLKDEKPVARAGTSIFIFKF